MNGMRHDRLEGRRLAGRYHIETLLGAGGMGAVYQARDEVDDTHVALKVLRPGERQTRFLPRLMREARLASRLHHDNVVRVLDHGRWGEDRERFYLAMELVEGVTLARFLDDPGDPTAQAQTSPPQLDTSAWCDVAVQLLSALAHVHARGVLHRDIKPENVLLSRTRAGRLLARIADFGLAAATADDADLTRLTQEGSLLGTPAYMAPEQIEGRSYVLGPPVDIYTIGVLLFELCTHRLPFEGTLNQMLVAKLQSTPPRLKDIRPDVPDELDLAVATMMARRPEDRYQLAADARDALEPLAEPAQIDDGVWNPFIGEATTGEERDTALAPTIAPGAHDAPGAYDDTLSAAHPDEAHGGTDAPSLCGRTDERRRIMAAAERAEDGAGHIVLVHGPVGMGKTSLVEHSARDLNEAGRFQVLRGKRPPASGIVGCMRAALDDWLGTQGRSVDEVKAVLGSRARRQRLEIPDLPATLGLMRESAAQDGHLDTQRACATFIDVLRALAASRPVFLILDDVDTGAGTAALLDLLTYELELDAFPVVAALTLPPVRSDTPVGRALGRTATSEGARRTTIALDGIEPDHLAPWLEQRHGITPHHAARIVRRAGGNPFFAEQLAALGAGELGSDDGLRSSAGDVSDGLPEALRALLLTGLDERLSRLPDRERSRALLDRAAILGEQVDVELLEEFCTETRGEALVSRLDDDLDGLIDAELLDDAGLDAVAFSNALLREVVLSRLSPRKRRRLHRSAALLREQQPSPLEHGAIGNHWAAAGDTGRAVDAWLRAHRRAREHGESGQALQWGRRAHDAMSIDDERRPSLALTVGRLLRVTADLDRAVGLLEPLLMHGDADVALQAGEILAEIAQEQFDIELWGQRLEQMRPRLSDASKVGRGAWCRARAFYLNYHGEVHQARPLAEEGRALADDPYTFISASRRLMYASVSLGDRDGALRIANETVERVGAEWPGHELEARSARMTTMLNYADLGAELDRVRALRDELRRAGRVARSISSTLELTGCLRMLGRTEEARALAERGYAMAVRFGMQLESLRFLDTLMACDATVGKPEVAQRRFMRMVETQMPTLPDPTTSSTICLVMLLMSVGADTRPEGVPPVDELVALLECGDLPRYRYFAESAFLVARRLHETGDAELARSVFEGTRRLFESLQLEDRIQACDAYISAED